MIHVIATIELRTGALEPFLEHFGLLVEDVRAEAGCLEYGAAVDLESGLGPQIPMRPDTVTVIEKWESLDHLRAHAQAPHMKSYREKVRDLVLSTRLQVLEPA